MILKRTKFSMDRFKICKECDRFNDIMKTCKECGCFMVLKTSIPLAECPLGKWGQVSEKEE